jgi:hypothetical protein
VVPDYAINSFVVVAADSRREVYLYSNERVSLDNAFCRREAKNIETIADKLEADWQV